MTVSNIQTDRAPHTDPDNPFGDHVFKAGRSPDIAYVAMEDFTFTSDGDHIKVHVHAGDILRLRPEDVFNTQKRMALAQETTTQVLNDAKSKGGEKARLAAQIEKALAAGKTLVDIDGPIWSASGYPLLQVGRTMTVGEALKILTGPDAFDDATARIAQARIVDGESVDCSTYYLYGNKNVVEIQTLDLDAFKALQMQNGKN